MSTGFVILAGPNPLYQSGDTSNLLIDAPVGKGKGIVKKPVRNRASAKGGPVIVHPIFAEAAEITDDGYWKSIFRDASLGKFPRGYRLVGDVLIRKVRSKNRDCRLDFTSAAACAETTKRFMQSQGLLSEADNKQKDIEVDKFIADQEKIVVNSWSKIRTNAQKINLVAEFASQLGRELKLNTAECRNLFHTINVGIVMGYLNSSTITVEGGRIVHIDTLVYEDGQFRIDGVKKHKRCREEDLVTDSEPRVESPCLFKEWVNLLTMLEKNLPRST